MFRPKAELLMILLRQVSNKIHISHPTCDVCKNYSTKTKKNRRICAEIMVIWGGGGRDCDFILFAFLNVHWDRFYGLQ